jgi:hypothetical protein
MVNIFHCINKHSILVACGYYLEDKRIVQLNEFLDERRSARIDLNTLLVVLTHLKELELMSESLNEGDEYCKLFL